MPFMRRRQRIDAQDLRLCVGFDVVSVPEVAASLDRYVQRIFTGREANYCRAAPTRHQEP